MDNTRSLWFTRKNQQITGPFSPEIIKNNLMLGRLSRSDEVSKNKLDWTRVDAVWELSLNIEHYDISERQKQLDERDGFDRRQSESLSSSDKRTRQNDRRAPEPPERIKQRQAHTRMMQRLKPKKQGVFWPFFATFSVLLAALILAFSYPKTVPSPLARCEALAGPNVNWSHCVKPKLILNNLELEGIQLTNSQLMGSQLINSNLSHANLNYADLRFSNLSYAQLNQATMLGADLEKSDLSHADLSDVDLSYADLRDAKLADAILKNTRFDNAIWVTGQLCMTDSVDRCVVAENTQP